MNIDEIKYGNPAFVNAVHLNQDGMFDSFIETFSQDSFQPPSNASMTTLNELIELTMLTGEIQSQEDFSYYSAIDGDLSNFLLMQIQNCGIKANHDVLSKIALDLNPTIIKIKMFYQRPRPFQLAYYRQLNLFPHLSVAANSPSYPSGHALQSYFICKLYSYKYKSKKSDLLSIAEEVAHSRKVMGLHYQSDNDFAKQIADEILQEQDIVQFYLQKI
jgi:hypothetical protein